MDTWSIRTMVHSGICCLIERAEKTVVGDLCRIWGTVGGRAKDNELLWPQGFGAGIRGVSEIFLLLDWQNWSLQQGWNWLLYHKRRCDGLKQASRSQRLVPVSSFVPLDTGCKLHTDRKWRFWRFPKINVFRYQITISSQLVWPAYIYHDQRTWSDLARRHHASQYFCHGSY